MSQARVLHVFKYFRPRFTGEGVFVERLAPVFQRLRPDVAHEVLVTATPRPAAVTPPPGLDGVHYLSRSEAGASQRDLVAWLARRGGRYEVIHHHTHVDRTFLGNLALKLQGRRLVQSATLDDSIPGLLGGYRPLLRPLVRRLFRLIDSFVAISPKLFEENNRLARPEASKLVPIGIPLPKPGPGGRKAARERLGLPPDATILLCVGGICARKDQLLLVRNLPALLLADPRLVLVLVGPVLEPDEQGRIEARMAEHGLAGRLLMAGHAAQPWAYYEAADLFVFASRQEGFGTVVIEAMAHGLPVVARGLPGVNDSFVQHGQTGFLFQDEASYRRHVEALLRDRGLRERIGAAARAYVAERFDIDRIAAEYLAIYGYPAEARP